MSACCLTVYAKSPGLDMGRIRSKPEQKASNISAVWRIPFSATALELLFETRSAHWKVVETKAEFRSPQEYRPSFEDLGFVWQRPTTEAVTYRQIAPTELAVEAGSD